MLHRGRPLVPTEEDAIWSTVGPLLLLLLLLLLGDFGRVGSFAFRSRHRVFTPPLLVLRPEGLVFDS